MRTALILVLLMSISSLLAQSNFPSEWIGKYEGEMLLNSANRPSSIVKVELDVHEVEKDSSWTYTMQYHSEQFGEMTKDYRIVRVKKGDSVNYVLDELNGIVMELTYMNNCFYGNYEVMSMIYSTTLRKVDSETIVFELFAGSMSQPKITYADNEEGKDPIEAKSYKPMIAQSVVLRRTN